jgi:hypothetical protein
MLELMAADFVPVTTGRASAVYSGICRLVLHIDGGA